MYQSIDQYIKALKLGQITIKKMIKCVFSVLKKNNEKFHNIFYYYNSDQKSTIFDRIPFLVDFTLSDSNNIKIWIHHGSNKKSKGHNIYDN